MALFLLGELNNGSRRIVGWRDVFIDCEKELLGRTHSGYVYDMEPFHLYFESTDWTRIGFGLKLWLGGMLYNCLGRLFLLSIS